MAIRMGGLNSGLDTDAIVSALVSAYSYKKTKYEKAQTKLSWTQDAWKSLNTKVYSLYTNISNLRYTSAYTLKKSAVSDATKATVSAGNSSVNGTQTLSISKVAQSGYLTGGEIKDATNSTKLSDLASGLTGGKINVTDSDGKVSGTVEITADDTISSVVNKFKDAGVNATYDTSTNRIFISSKKSGSKNDFNLVAADSAGQKALETLKLDVGVNTTSATYKAYESYKNLVAADGTKASTVNEIKQKYNEYQDAKAAQTDATNKLTAIQAVKADTSFSELSAMSSDEKRNALVGSTDGKVYTKTGINNEKGEEMYGKDGVYFVTRQETVYKDSDGKELIQQEDGSYKYADGTAYDGTVSSEAVDKYYLVTAETAEDGTVTYTTADEASTTTFKSGKDTYDEKLESYKADGLDDAAIAMAIDSDSSAYDAQVAAYRTTINTNKEVVDNTDTIIANMSSEDDAEAVADQAIYAKNYIATNAGKTGSAVKIDGSDSEITLNGVTYTSDSNSYSINGLNITANAVTTEDITITTSTDTQGIYDKIKDFLSEYNSVINELVSVYNADSAKGYEPLSSDEKEAMSDKEVEKWEQKIKDSLLRRDTTLDSLINAMTSSMSKAISIDGKNYTMASFGIQTLGYLNAGANEQYAYHINGDEDDVSTSSNEDKLMAAINSDPDTVIEYFKQLANNLYDTIDAKMSRSTLSSSYTIYNDKQMSSQYNEYTDLIKTWEDRISEKEDYYYDKFTAMETAMAKLNSTQSSLSGYFS